jgi:hypothetical protein
MTDRRALVVVAVAGLALLALSFLNGWIVHDREIRGEGFRESETLLSGWKSISIPVLSVGAVAAGATGVAAIVLLARPGALPRWLLLAGSIVALAIVASSLVPLSWDGHTTSVDLRPGFLTVVGLVLAVVMVVAAGLASGASGAAWLAFAVGGALVAGAAVAGRWGVLTVAGPSNQNWEDGTYVRDPGGAAELTLIVEDGRYRIGDRWAGTWEGSGGWTVALDNDPACPESRGAYHAHGEGDDDADLRFVKIVDTCADGQRAADLESAIWVRQR